MAAFQDFAEDIPFFVEAGLIAIKQGDEESAKKLFNAVGVLDPQNSDRKVGHGLIALHKMDVKGAQKQFNEVLKVEPQNYRAQAFLALSYLVSVLDENTTNDVRMEGLKKGAEIATEVVNKCDAPSTKALATSILDWEDELQKATESSGPVS